MSQLHHVKAFIVIALLAWSATRVAAAESMPDSSHTECDSRSGLGQRCLRSNVTMTTNKFEERGRLPASLRLSRSKADLQADAEVLAARQEYSNFRFFDHNLDKTKANKLFVTPNFYGWISDVRKQFTYPSKKKEADAVVEKTLSRHFGDAVLADVLSAEIRTNRAKISAELLLELQVKRWVNQKKSADDVFMLLKLDKADADNPLGSHVFSQWVAFVTSSHKSSTTPKWYAMYSTLSSHCGEDALAKILVAEMTNVHRYHLPQVLLTMRLLKGQLAGENTAKVRIQLELDKTEGPVRVFWESFMDLFGKSDSDIFKKFRKYFGDAKVAEMFATATTESVLGRPVQKLRVEQFTWCKARGVNPDEIETVLRKGGVSNDGVIKRIAREYAVFYNI